MPYCATTIYLVVLLSVTIGVNHQIQENEQIALVESSTSQHTPTAICNKKLTEFTKSTQKQIFLSWYNNPKETTAWSRTKDCSTIYIRYLKDTTAPLPRKSRDSWWPLRYSPRKAYQKQQFKIYYSGRTFYGIDSTKFSLGDAKELDKQILDRMFKDNVNNMTRAGITNHCVGQWESNKAVNAYKPETLLFSSSMRQTSVTSLSSTTYKRKQRQSYIDTVGIDENAVTSDCYIGVLDIPTKCVLSREFAGYDDDSIVHIGWNAFAYNASVICQCQHLYIRITRTIGNMPYKILGDASDAIFIFAAWYPTIRERRVYIKVDQSKTFKKAKKYDIDAYETPETDTFTARIVEETLDESAENTTNINPISTLFPINITTKQPTQRQGLQHQLNIHKTNKNGIFNGSLIAMIVIVLILLCIAFYFIRRMCYESGSVRGVSLMVTRHPIKEHDLHDFETNVIAKTDDFIMDDTMDIMATYPIAIT